MNFLPGVSVAPIDPADKSGLNRFTTLLLTDDHRQRRRIMMVLTTAVMYAVCVGLLRYGIAAGFFEPARVNLLTLLCALNAVAFYTIVRSGYNLRFEEPSLAFPQAIIASTLTCMAYAVSGPVHASTLVFLMLAMFFGMFGMETGKVRALTLYTLTLMAVVMAWSTYSNPAVYPYALEVFYFCVIGTALPAVGALSVQLSNMRKRLRSQKGELEAALVQIRHVATHDELTGLPNRRHMQALLAEHQAGISRGAPGFQIAMLDIDLFKHVNDSFGHRVGDEVLVCFAQQARLHLRAIDIVARWGGEEFLAILPGAPPDDSNAGIERLREVMAATQVSTAAPELRIAFSAGMTRFIAGEAIDDTIERADRALYEAKKAGRNRTTAL